MVWPTASAVGREGGPAEVSGVWFGLLKVSRVGGFIKAMADLPTYSVGGKFSAEKKKHDNILLQPITEVAQPDRE